MKLHEIASFLASSDPAERQLGLGWLHGYRDASHVPVLIHLLHGAHPDARAELLARIGAFGKGPVAQALGQLLESDAPHPESALFYLSLASDAAYNGLMLSLLPGAPGPIQVGLLHVLARTADEGTKLAMAPLASHLTEAARMALARLFERPARKQPAQAAGTPDGKSPARHVELPNYGLHGHGSAVDPGSIRPTMAVSGSKDRTAELPLSVRPTMAVLGPKDCMAGSFPSVRPEPPSVARRVEGWTERTATQSESVEGRTAGPPSASETDAEPYGLTASEEPPPQALRAALEAAAEAGGAKVSKDASAEPARKLSLRERIQRRQREHAASSWAKSAAAWLGSAGLLAVWMAAAALLGRAAWESLALSTPLKFATPAAFALCMTVCLAGWRRIPCLDKAALTSITLAASAAACAVFTPAGTDAFRLFGRGQDFWGVVVCLAAVALLAGATLFQSQWPRAARLTSLGICGYTSLGFVKALAAGLPLEAALLGDAALAQVPWPLLQPVPVFVNALLPAGMLMALVHRARGSGAPGWRGPWGALVFLAVPLLSASALMSPHLLPNPLSLALGRPVGSGATGADYVSAWDAGDTGTARHRVEVVTRGHIPGSRRRTYEMQASIVPAGAPGKPSELRLFVKDTRLGRPIRGLRPDDLELFENGARQTILSLEPLPAPAREPSSLQPAASSLQPAPGYRISYVKALPPMPVVRLTSPADGARIGSVLDLAAEADRPGRVDLYVDDEPIATFDSPPVRAAEPVEAFSAGRHRVRAVVRDRYGRTAEDQRDVLIVHSLPDLAVLSPTEGSAIWGDDKLEVTLGGVQAARVELMVDGTVLKRFGAATGPIQVASADLEATGLPPEAAIRRGTDPAVYSVPFNARSLHEGLHRFGVRVTCPDGRIMEKKVSAMVVRPIVAVRFMTPQYRARLAGRAQITAEAVCSWPELGIARLELTVNGKRLALLEKAPYIFTWDTAGWAPGRYRLDAIASSFAGDVGSAAVTVEVARPEPALAVEGLWDGAVVAAPVELRASVTGTAAQQLRRVDYSIAGRTAGSLTAAPFSWRLDAAGRPDGDTLVGAEATLADGRRLSRTFKVRFAAGRRSRFFACALKHGAPVSTGMTPAVSVDGRPAADVELRPASEVATSYALVVDVSASMASGDKQSHLREAVSRFLGGLRPVDRVALFAFNDDVTSLKAFTSDRAALLEALGGIRAFGATALNDAVFRAAEALGEEKGRRVMLLVTDGIDQNIDRTGPVSARLLPQAVALARNRGVAVHAIGIGRELRQDAALGERALTRLAAETGGSYSFAPWARDLADAFAAISRQLAAETEVSVAAADNWGERWHSAAVRWPGDFATRAAPGYFGL